MSSYALVTAAFNEAAYIDKTLATVVAQTLPPLRWIVVSDGSTDETDMIVQRYSERYKFIQLYRITERHARNFTAQVHAINTGFNLLRDLDYKFIGNLDADISLEPWYFERLIKEFHKQAQLGLAGGCLYEKEHGSFRARKTNRPNSVPHGIQLFRRECFESLGNYAALPYGGPDWHAEVTARKDGWRVVSFASLPVYHHRPTGTAGSLLRYWYRQGLMDFSLGTHPLFEIGKLVLRLPERPLVLGASVRLAGFAHAYIRRDARPVPDDFVLYLRNEQKDSIRRAVLKMFVRPNQVREPL